MLRHGVAYLGKVVPLAILYAVTAQTVFALASVHTSISPIWLPSGLAVAAAVLYGYRALPAILLGAFAFNASTDIPLWVAALIAAGNTLEAAAAGWLLRLSGFRRPADRIRDVLALVGLAGLAATAVSATVGVTALWAGGVIPAAEAVSSWILWWFGDAIGVMTLTPVLLVAWARRRRWRRPSRTRTAEAGLLSSRSRWPPGPSWEPGG
nr:hypothetical protein GCM10020093_086570 [Planobispora longispora]